MNQAEIILESYFGKNFEKYESHEHSYITKEEILNPTKEKFLLVKKIIKQYRENNPISKTLEDFLYIFAAMTAAIPYEPVS